MTLQPGQQRVHHKLQPLVLNVVIRGFRQHLQRCGFDPLNFDGRDPAAFTCALWEMEQRLEHRVQELHIKTLHILIELIERKLSPQNYA